ncbi:ATP-dependent zinc metalloprotease FTSH 4, mitochondrial-like [Xenia sp. Carnegie-2017]|uniref:ATP-dependent zinc metalloprotease FTSH 4, mitochondrial-like n=1 Tax=Xenia sp. Carnegie-2017 TaxID=2897299 RepID=UPI001F03CB11|nr:ATP-dependent zinc metalloprotease FTSH 4, mitochondrial-like [Xenia sp. Carnegie-2017]
MLSSLGLNYQVLSNFIELTGHLHQLKSSVWPGFLTYLKCLKKKVHHESIPYEQEYEVKSQTPISELLKNLPHGWQRLLSPLSITLPTHKIVLQPWATSYISGESFYENKHGFRSSRLLGSSSTMWHKISLQPMWSRKNGAVSTRNIYTYSAQQIRDLEERANDNPNDPDAQADYLKAIVSEDPHYVIRRYESGKYKSSDEVYREYYKALVMTDKIRNDEIGEAARKPFLSFRQRPAKSSSSELGSEGNPVVVSMNNDKRSFFKEQLWNTLRFLIGLFLIVSVLEAQLQMRMTSNQKEVQPDSSDKKVKFSDVQGVEEAKLELREIVEFLRSPEKFTKLGGKLPSGILLVGAPGTGKTLLAKAVAGEAGVPFFFCSGAEFDEMFVGVGAARVRNLFASAKELSPCIIFIDELDAIGGTRSVGDHQPYSRMTLNQLLVELDGFDKTEGIVVIAATNFPEILDKALVRPGRFDSRVTVPMPDVRARKSILELHLGKVEMADDVSPETLARGTPGFSGADLANLVNQAALKAASEGHAYVNNEHLEYSKDKIIMGPERKSAFIEQKNREVVAYHEGGHALVAYYTSEALPLHKATIVPRGDALGLVAQLPEKDELSWTKKQLMAKLDVCMGGRVAEELVFGSDNITSGASSDFFQANKIARAMVTKYAMSDKVGPLVITDEEKLSPELHNSIENEVKRLIKESYERAKNIIQSYSIEHKRLAEALLKYETLNVEDIEAVIQGRSIE